MDCYSDIGWNLQSQFKGRNFYLFFANKYGRSYLLTLQFN